MFWKAASDGDTQVLWKKLYAAECIDCFSERIIGGAEYPYHPSDPSDS